MIGDEPFVVLLADDLIQSDVPVLRQMVHQFERLRASMVATIEVPNDQTNRYGILEGEQISSDVFRVHSMVEKPQPEEAPSNLAAIGRYILPLRYLTTLGNKVLVQEGKYSLLMRWLVYYLNNQFLVLILRAPVLIVVIRPVFKKRI